MLKNACCSSVDRIGSRGGARDPNGISWLMSNTSIVPKDAMTFRLPKSAPNTKGILCILGAGPIFSFTDAVSKMMMDDYPVGEVIFFWGFFVLLVTVATIRMQGDWCGVRFFDW